jgi:AcrR family transcriptional regulator
MAKKGATREIILKAAAKVFFENGFEKTSVKMILEEAHIVTGSFYHFFSSKEALFEAVTESFLKQYAQRVGNILDDETLDISQIAEKVLEELKDSAEKYYLELQGDKLHWTVQLALHEMTLQAMEAPLARALARLKESGKIKNYLDADDKTLARILIKGSEAVIHHEDSTGVEWFRSKQMNDNLMQFWSRIIEL